MAAAATEALRHEVGCPFCGLVCDDLTIGQADGRLRVLAGGCPISRARFEAPPDAASPMVDGRPVDLSRAVGRAADILSGSRAPIFLAAADVAGTRAVLRLAERLGGVIDHPSSDALFRSLRVMQDAGALATTLGEVRNRADLVLIVGPDPSPSFPRFVERCLAPRKTLFSDDLRRHVFYLGPPSQHPTPDPAEVTLLPCALDRLPEAIAVCSALLRGGVPGAPGVGGVPVAGLASLVERLKSARYGTVVWSPALFQDGSALLAQALLELARELTRSTRCVVLPLGGGANLLGVNQVCTWQTGWPIRTSFGGGVPEHDPYRFSARRMLADGEADALVWAAPLSDEAPPACDVPAIVIAPSMARVDSPAVSIPVGIPGVDHAGQVFRTDAIVALQLAALRAAPVPDVAAVIAAIEARLASGAAAH
jgi:formylmethanofuran dehydrogenase subunit B